MPLTFSRPPRHTLDSILRSYYIYRVVEVIATDEFAAWYETLDDPGADDVDVAIGLLETRGVRLGSTTE